MNLDCGVDDFFMHGKCVADMHGGQRLVMRQQAQRAGVSAGADAPDVQVGQFGLASLLCKMRFFAHSATSTAPTMPVAGSSQAQP